ncbi:MAG: sigma-70 family RNA polymerase sigma factor [Chloroflexota bacterium]|nr:sigma-70 family RNA polymerase sigma factor [Chloroflexota bacterium]
MKVFSHPTRRRSNSPEATSTEREVVTPAEETPTSDERLIQAARRGELASFNALVLRHERVVFNVCLRLLRDPGLAEDAAQDTFIRAWTNIGSFRGGVARAWLLRIATNRAYDLLRARGRRPAESLDSELVEMEPAWTGTSPSEEPENFATRRELAIYLEQALAILPDDQRLAIILSDIQGYGYDEIATITGVAAGTVKSRISRGRGRLRQALRDDPAAGELLERFSRLNRVEDELPVPPLDREGRRTEAYDS